MVQDESEASGASSSKKLLGLLEGLKRTPVGAVIYDQVARIVEEQEGVQAKVDHVYASLLHLLLNAYARDPSADHITRINARLIQLRSGPIIPRIIDEIPVLAVAACAADGTTIVRNASELRVKESDRIVLLKADKDVPYGKVVNVMAEIRKAGIQRVGMITEPAEGE